MVGELYLFLSHSFAFLSGGLANFTDLCVQTRGIPRRPRVNKVNFLKAKSKRIVLLGFFGGGGEGRQGQAEPPSGQWRNPGGREGGRGRGVTGQGGGDGQSHGGKVSRLFGSRPGSGLRRLIIPEGGQGSGP